MAATSVLIIELLDGLGAHEADAALRLRTMRCAGRPARTLVLESVVEADAASAWHRAAARVVAERPSEAWVAGSHASWRALARELPSGLACAWWPAIVPGSGDEPEAAPLGAALVAASGAAPIALELAPVRASRERTPVALWDGDFVLVPGPMHGTEGVSLLRAFAEAAAERPELELVVLAEPQAELTAAARALGVGWRVHCAGPAPREAEHTWLATAAAVLLPVSQQVSAGLVLRTLAAGSPLVVDPAATGARAVAGWLEAWGMPAPRATDEALEAALAGEPWVREACERGRTLAAGHEPAALAVCFGAQRGRDDGRARKAA